MCGVRACGLCGADREHEGKQQWVDDTSRRNGGKNERWVLQSSCHRRQWYIFALLRTDLHGKV